MTCRVSQVLFLERGLILVHDMVLAAFDFVDHSLVVAAGALDTIRVLGSTSSQGGTYSDTLTFAAVPEPATRLMMVGGFGLMGAAMRRRKISISFA